MNRPTRVPSPPDDAHFTEVEEHQTVAAERVNHPAPAVRAQQTTGLPSEGPVQQPSLPITPFAKLAGAIAAVMAEIKPVEKSGWNDFYKYNYAKMGDLSIELTPLMGRHGIVVFQNEVDRAMFDEGKVISVRYQFTVVHSSGEIWPERPLITGMSRCRDSKGGFDDKAFNKADTAARKYFLLSLFQIPTDDEHPDTDGDGGGQQQRAPQQRPQGRRPVPSPNGKVPPHLMPINDGESAVDWATRFGEVIAKAASVAEIDQWYAANAEIFEKMKRFPQVYNDAIDFMDACAAKLTKPKADPITSGPTKAESDFPGDKPIQAAAEPITVNTSIPLRLDRNLSDPEREWILACDDAFKECTDVDSLRAEQESVMLPSKDSVSEHAWARAVAIVKQHVDRITQ